MKDYIKSYLLDLCCSYTIISVIGAIINIISGYQTNNANVVMMFIFCNIAVFVLSIHKFFEAFSPLAMIIIQYILALVLIFLVIFIASFIEPVSPRGWFEFFRSFTIPYIIGAALYYYKIFKETKEQDEMIKEIQKHKEEV